jgi:succinate dehydrogenase / fumarate reductase, cytochrome b subunit
MAQATTTREPVSGTALQQRKHVPYPVELYRTSVGKKYVMAITGILWMGFVVAHMFGNLKMYFGPAQFDHYADFLRELLYPLFPRTWVLWGMRLVLIAALILHLLSAAQLTVQNRRARPIKYQSPRDYVAANFASRTMRWTGIIVLAFLLFHLSDLTWGFANPDFVRGDAYANVTASLERVPVAIFYILANIALGIHLFHGGWSLFQSMGWSNPRFNEWRRGFAVGFAAIIVIANCSFPIAVLAGIVG